jgi:hypothetical protein
LVELVRSHVGTYRVPPADRLFVNHRGPGGRCLVSAGRPLSSSAYSRVWQKARTAALSQVEQHGPLAKVPYHLRHAAVFL